MLSGDVMFRERRREREGWGVDKRSDGAMKGTILTDKRQSTPLISRSRPIKRAFSLGQSREKEERVRES